MSLSSNLNSVFSSIGNAPGKLRNGRGGKIGRRLLFFVLSLSSIFAFAQTLIQLKFDYDAGVSEIDRQFVQIKLSYLDSLSQSIWDVNTDQVEIIATGIKTLPNVIMVSVVEILAYSTESDNNTSSMVEIGAIDNHNFVENEMSILRDMPDGTKQIGNLNVVISLDPLYQALYDQFIFLLVFQMVKTLSVSIFILFIFHFLVTQHLIQMAEFSRNISLDNLEERLTLKRKNKDRDDELGSMETALNETKQNLKKMLEANQSKLSLENELEQKAEKEKIHQVYSATIESNNKQLEQQNDELESTLEELKDTQDRLVQSEKIASLGLLVRGVAHELNTPLGILKMANSMAQQNFEDLATELKTNTLSEKSLTEKEKKQDKTNELLTSNIDRMARLTSTFKQIATNENQETKKTFLINLALEDCVKATRIEHPNSAIKINLICEPLVEINSYPAAFSQTVIELLNNAFTHAFDESAKDISGNIDITLTKTSPSTLKLSIEDNGIGVDTSMLNQLFDPFYTTSSEAAHIGLGLHIAYNAISHQLEGTILCESERNKGTKFHISLPYNLAA